MSFTIPIAFVQRYHDDVIELAQQRESRLMRTVRDDPDNMDGKAGYFDRIGAVEAQENTSRHSDTPINPTPHSRRRIILRDFDWYDLIDKKDMRRILNAGAMPARYVANGVRAMNRKKDDLIIAAASGNAYSMDEDDAASAVPLPSSQKILVNHGGGGDVGLTLAKLLAVKEIIDGSDVDEEEPRYGVVTSKQVTDLLNTTEVKSSEYNTVRALAEGRINTFLGFEFIRSERLVTDASNDRLCLFYTQTAIGLAKGQEVQTDIGPRRDKRNSTQCSVDFSMDATRIEDEKLVEVACDES